MGRAGETKVTAAVIAAAVIASIVGVTVSLWAAAADHQSILGPTFNAAVVMAFAAVGAMVAAARPGNRVGWGMLVGGVLWSLGGGGADLAHHGIVSVPGSVPAVAAFAIGGSALRSVGWYVVTLVVPATFPDGRLPPTRHRWFTVVLVIIVVGAVLDPIADKQADLTNLGAWHNPIAPGHPWDFVSALAFFAHIPLSLVATVAVVGYLIGRWRRGDALRRQQISLFAAAAAVPVVAVPVAFAFGAGGWVFGAAAVPLPFAIGFAVLARGLYDLRSAANRTVVWLALSAIVAGIYALVIVGVAGLLHVGRDAPWLPWAAAAVTAVSFAPLRDGLQRAVNRLTYGRWDEPYDVLAALGQRLAATADLDRLLSDVTTELRGLGLREVSVHDQHGTVVAGDVGDNADRRAMPLSAFGEPAGTLRYQPPAAPLRTRDHRLLDDLAGHLGAVLHAHRLTADLQRALERLVVAREEERRRLRRDLHDGLGPALSGHLLRLDLVAARIGANSPASADVDILRDDLRATVLEVRRVVEGLRPPSLDDLGLAGAVSQTTRRLVAGSGLDLDLDVGELPPLPAAMEVAAYRIVTEAVTNVVRHARATICHVEVHAHDALLRVRVSDDGRGLAAEDLALGGNGLQTMRERAEELRGHLDIASAVGTTVVAELPLPSSARSRAPDSPMNGCRR
jgi:signal transduction histidine kinase